MYRSCAAFVLALLTLAGCSRVDASTPKTVAATPNLPCSLPYGTRVTLLSPVPGSRAVAAGNAPVVLAASRDLPKTMAVIATDGRGHVSPGSPLERTARPPAKAQPAFPDAVYYRASGIALKAHRHYTIALDDLAQNGCSPYAEISGNARFSTG